MRAFIAVSLSVKAFSSLGLLQRDLARSGADVKWTAVEHLHLTLKFLADMSEEQRKKIEELLARVAKGYEPFDIELDGLGAFPSFQAPRVIWVGLAQGEEKLTRLAEAIEQEGASIFLEREQKPFSVHVTLGRVRSGRHLNDLTRLLQTIEWKAPESWSVDTLSLYQSVLSSAGPHYSLLADVPLGSR